MCSRWRPASSGRASGDQLVLPTDKVELTISVQGSRHLVLAEWGLVPSWSRERPRPPRFNARAETILEKPSFRESIKTRRGILEVEAYVEHVNKVPHDFGLPDGPMLHAAIWDEWVEPSTGEVVRSCATITCAPNECVEPHYDRMPVIIAVHDVDAWLNGTLEQALALLVPYAGEMTITPTGIQRPLF